MVGGGAAPQRLSVMASLIQFNAFLVLRTRALMYVFCLIPYLQSRSGVASLSACTGTGLLMYLKLFLYVGTATNEPTSKRKEKHMEIV